MECVSKGRFGDRGSGVVDFGWREGIGGNFSDGGAFSH